MAYPSCKHALLFLFVIFVPTNAFNSPAFSLLPSGNMMYARARNVNSHSALRRRPAFLNTKAVDLGIAIELLQNIGATSSLLLSDETIQAVGSGVSDLTKPAYAQSSYYATLGLFVLTFPGLWSLVKRSVTYSPVRKTYVTRGPAQGKEIRQTAGEITAYFRSLNFLPEPTADVVTFRGTMGRSRGQAFYISFCTFMGLASLAIVLTIQFPLVADPGEFSPWYYLTLLSPLGGWYYWTKASKDVTVQVKLEEAEEGSVCEVTTVGAKEELERFCEVMGFNEKGMVRVPGLLETLSDASSSS